LQTLKHERFVINKQDSFHIPVSSLKVRRVQGMADKSGAHPGLPSKSADAMVRPTMTARTMDNPPKLNEISADEPAGFRRN